jgi:hypothetical protein
MTRKSTKQRGKAGKAGQISDSELLTAPVVGLSGVWTGQHSSVTNICFNSACFCLQGTRR